MYPEDSNVNDNQEQGKFYWDTFKIYSENGNEYFKYFQKTLFTLINCLRKDVSIFVNNEEVKTYRRFNAKGKPFLVIELDLAKRWVEYPFTGGVSGEPPPAGRRPPQTRENPPGPGRTPTPRDQGDPPAGRETPPRPGRTPPDQGELPPLGTRETPLGPGRPPRPGRPPGIRETPPERRL